MKHGESFLRARKEFQAALTAAGFKQLSKHDR